MNNTVSLKLNANNFLKNIGAIFTSSERVLQELIQNASRAKSTYVSIDYDASKDVLIITDDGKGISDMQSLFYICKSGWDDETVASQNPYGMGFIGVLFNCSHLIVTSNGTRLETDTADILNNQPISLTQVTENEAATTIELHGLTANFTMFLADMLVAVDPNRYEKTKLALGYNLPVIFNGVTLSNSHSINVLENNSNIIKHQFEYGTIYANINQVGFVNLPTHTKYLQGARISLGSDVDSHYHRFNNDIVIHFSDNVRARMPDRAQCLDSQIITETLQKEETALNVRLIQENIRLYGSKKWFYLTSENWKLGVQYTPELISALDGVSKEVLYDATIHSFNMMEGTDYEESSKIISKADIASGSYAIFEMPENEEGQSHLSDLYVSSVPSLPNCLFYNADEELTDNTIWKTLIESNITKKPDESDIKITPVNAGQSHYFNGGHLDFNIVMCDEVLLEGEFGTAVIQCEPVFTDCTVYVTKHIDADTILRWISDYSGEYSDFEEERFEEDEYDLDQLLILMSCKTPESFMVGMLKQNSHYQALKTMLGNASLNLTFDEAGEPQVTCSKS